MVFICSDNDRDVSVTHMFNGFEPVVKTGVLLFCHAIQNHIAFRRCEHMPTVCSFKRIKIQNSRKTLTPGILIDCQITGQKVTDPVVTINYMICRVLWR